MVETAVLFDKIHGLIEKVNREWREIECVTLRLVERWKERWRISERRKRTRRQKMSLHNET